MKLLAIETSCDETAIAIMECEGDTTSARFRVLGNALLSQIEVHKEYGGVFPMLAKREHAKNLVPILSSALEEAEMQTKEVQTLPEELSAELATLLEREPGLGETLLSYLTETAVPSIDAVVVTHGPGLEPALWVGVNFAKALALAWDKPLIGANHMEGHLLSALAKAEDESLVIADTALPVVGLLISGGHTQIVAMKEWFVYEIMGDTRDDAVGEAFDKVARMLDLPYPGGPQISKLAEEARVNNEEKHPLPFPRPMINDNTCNFSFSGLKTAIMYQLKKMEGLDDMQKKAIAREFEDAVADVLWTKTARALDETNAQTLVIGGGVSGNQHIRRVFEERVAQLPYVSLHIPPRELTTDNAVMIGMSGYFRYLRGMRADLETLRAEGNLSLV
ncbi:MAG: tRNA (adenosine(37)-N6)-threonylcarbamoyltransferase complex transferase subunit TsaD [Patescibacteria group bacterium]